MGGKMTVQLEASHWSKVVSVSWLALEEETEWRETFSTIEHRSNPNPKSAANNDVLRSHQMDDIQTAPGKKRK
jgi:hypothetical protein